ncbi:MAG: hypothetical protein QXI59_06330 [Candidatus Bathyarchaeia archaeon]|nr:hypothetical protein [Candidatus Bathyarchaeota archaeon]
MDENHRRALNTSLRIIERYLNMINGELAYENATRNLILTSTINDIDHETRTRILEVTASMLDGIKKMKEEYKLEKDEMPLKRLLCSLLAEIKVILEELKPEKMEKAYGQISEADRKLLKPHILNLLELWEEAYQTLVSP